MTLLPALQRNGASRKKTMEARSSNSELGIPETSTHQKSHIFREVLQPGLNNPNFHQSSLLLQCSAFFSIPCRGRSSGEMGSREQGESSLTPTRSDKI